jgi:hypothetical protein
LQKLLQDLATNITAFLMVLQPKTTQMAAIIPFVRRSRSDFWNFRKYLEVR